MQEPKQFYEGAINTPPNTQGGRTKLKIANALGLASRACGPLPGPRNCAPAAASKKKPAT
jgi:hypothetical protein